MSFQLNTILQNLLVDCLRDAFLTNSDYLYVPNLGGTPNVEETQIAIYRQFPKTLSNYPEIAVNPPRIPILGKTLGNNFIGAVVGDIGGVSGLCNETYGGIANGEFSIIISANSEPERDTIADYIISYLNHSSKSYLEDRAVEVVDVSKQGEKIIPHLNDYIYVSEVSVSLWGEWSDATWYTGDILSDVALCQISISDFGDFPGLTNI